MAENTPTRGFVSMPRSLGRGAHEGVIWEALQRVDGKPAPEIGRMQESMGAESRIRITAEVIRTYLDVHGRDSVHEVGAARRG